MHRTCLNLCSSGPGPTTLADLMSYIESVRCELAALRDQCDDAVFYIEAVEQAEGMEAFGKASRRSGTIHHLFMARLALTRLMEEVDHA